MNLDEFSTLNFEQNETFDEQALITNYQNFTNSKQINNTNQMGTGQAAILSENVQVVEKKKPPPSRVDILLEDDEKMYLTDDDDTNDALMEDGSNKENQKSVPPEASHNQTRKHSTSNIIIDETNFKTQEESNKKLKQLNPYEICEKIHQLSRLTKLTILAPFIPTDSAYLSTQTSMPFFLSLEALAKESLNHNYLRCKVIAKLFNYSISSNPPHG